MEKRDQVVTCGRTFISDFPLFTLGFDGDM